MLRFTTFLSPLMYDTYEYIAHYVGQRIGISTMFGVGQSTEEFGDGRADVGFMCGLLYARCATQPRCPIEPLTAPVLSGERYQSQPIYFSDIVVRSDSPYTTFDDLEGCVWAYNERESHSGYNLVQAFLYQRNKTLPYFGTMVKTGEHQASLQAILDGNADTTAIDSHVFDVWRLRNPDLTSQLRVINTLGPSPIPPIVVSTSLDRDLKRDIQEAFLTMHHDPFAANRLRASLLVEQFVAVGNEDYKVKWKTLEGEYSEKIWLFVRMDIVGEIQRQAHS